MIGQGFRGGGAPANKLLKGFTLAEVLITLGVLGIVIAMTLPTLVQKHKERVLVAKLQKFYSTMNQAIMLAENVYGERETWFEDIYGVDEDGNSLNQVWFDRYLKKYLNILKEEPYKSGIVIYYLVDGGAFMNAGSNGRDWFFFPGNPKRCLEQYNYNTNKIAGRCAFSFYYNPVNSAKNTRSREFAPYGVGSWDGKEASLYNHSSFGCSENSEWGGFCTLLIQFNGWKIPKDYPFKIWF